MGRPVLVALVASALLGGAVASVAEAAKLYPISMATAKRQAKNFAATYARKTDAVDWYYMGCVRRDRYRVYCNVKYDYDAEWCSASVKVTEGAEYYYRRQFAFGCSGYDVDY